MATFGNTHDNSMVSVSFSSFPAMFSLIFLLGRWIYVTIENHAIPIYKTISRGHAPYFLAL